MDSFKAPKAANNDRTHETNVGETDPLEDKLLMTAIIQSDVIALSVLVPVFSPHGDVIDFVWSIANKLLRAIAQHKFVEGKLYSEVFAQSRTDGTLDAMITAYTNNRRTVNEVYYQNYNLKGWLRQVCMRFGSRLIVTAEDITLAKKSEKDLQTSMDEISRMNELLARQSAAEYHALFSSIDQGFAIIKQQDSNNGKEFAFTKVNPAFERLTGRTELIGYDLAFSFNEESSQWRELCDDIVNSQQPKRRTFLFDNGTRYIEVYGFQTGGSVQATIALLLTDVTQRTITEKKLKELNTRLKDLDASKTTFLNNVSHEFKTPIALILGPLNELLKQPDSISSEAKGRIELAIRNAGRLNKLVSGLLDFARIESGHIDTYYQPTDISQLTTDLVANFRSIIEEAGLKFIVKVDKISDPAYINREMWEKIVYNLLSNAFKYTHSGRIEIVLREKKHSIQFVVRDTGIGIARKNQDRIFNRFVRIEGPKGRTYEGTGIGLALVKELVLAHQGTIKLKSLEDKGSDFIVEIPRGRHHLRTDQIFVASHTNHDGIAGVAYTDEARTWLPEAVDVYKLVDRKRNANERPTILVVDDNADMRSFVTRILQSKYHVIALENGKKAFAILLRGMYPDLILTDVMMPEMDGYDLVTAVKNNPKFASIPVVLLSARRGEKDVITGITSGADDFLAKPFSVEQLMATIESRLSKSKIDYKRISGLK